MKKELSYLETVKLIAETKKHFEGQLEARLGIIKVQSPIFLKTSSGLQDQLSGTEKAVGFERKDEKYEYDKKLDKTIEISSMGIRVDEKSLIEQLEKSDCMDRLEMPYHQKIIKKEIPYTIGGGIGQSRIFMLLLEKEHIAEVQASVWDEKVYAELADKKIL